MRYRHQFQVKAPLSKVAAFHYQPVSLVAITPPLIRVQLHHAPADMLGGGKMDFTLWAGPLPIHWVVNIEEVSESGFTDRQLSGPFANWVHRHSFIRVDDHTTQVIDQISFQLKNHLLWGMVGLVFTLGFPGLFAYRSWKTCRLLEAGSK
jgi:ligand-binding SRPBCC domain-containing protein